LIFAKYPVVMKFTIFLVMAFCSSAAVFSQPAVFTRAVLETNEQIDRAVVAKDINTLSKLYAKDFVFTHGTGVVDSKETWIRTVERNNTRFVSRTHDSTSVELHGDIAIVPGRLDIVRMDDGHEVRYSLWYIRIFRLRGKQWELISHRTTKEWHY
jgi:ketosteroid isomerase-like protein